MASFKVDTESFDKAMSAYQTELQNLKDIKTSIQNIIDELKNEGWDSEAGVACMKKFDEEWAPNIDKYIVFVEHLGNVLSKSKPEFDRLVDEARDLQNIG